MCAERTLASIFNLLINFNEGATTFRSELCSLLLWVGFQHKRSALSNKSILWESLGYHGIYHTGYKCQSLSGAWLFATPWTPAHQAPVSMRFSRQGYWICFCKWNLFVSDVLCIIYISNMCNMFMNVSLCIHFPLCESESSGRSVVSDCLRTRGLCSPWNSSDQNIGVGSHLLLQGIFPTERPNRGLLHCGRIPCRLS